MNENPYLPTDNIFKAAITGLEKLNRYSELKYINELKNLLGKYNNVPANRIILSHGSDLLLREIINVFSKGRKIIMASPSFFPITQYALRQAEKITKIQLSPPAFKLNSNLLLAQLDEPTLLIIDNPSNPTGKILLDNDLVVKILQNKNALLLVDEAYYEFSGQTFVELIEKYPNLAITRTMDKAFSLAGLRLGYLLMGDYFKQYFTDFPTYLSTPTIMGAIEALKGSEYMNTNITKILHEKEKIKKALTDIGIIVFSSKTNFILIKTDIPDIAIKLKEAGILIKDISDEWLQGYYRISIGLPGENNSLLSTIKEFI
jgi:histidinol-phosphate aminotransferase